MRPFALGLIGALLATASVPAPLAAQTFMSGQDLAENCLVDPALEENRGRFSMCIGFVRATYERLWVNAVASGNDIRDCVPEGTTNRQILDGVLGWLHENTPGEDTLATNVVRQALIETLPACFGASAT